MALYGRPAELPPPPPASWYDNSGSPCFPTTSSQDYSTVESVDQFVPGPEEYSAAVFPFPPLDDNIYATKQPNIIFDVCQEDLWTSSPTDITSEPFVPHIPQPAFHRRKCPSSTISASTSISSSAASTWSSVQTDDDCQTIVPISSSSRVPSPSAPVTLPQRMVCLGPQCSEAFTSDAALEAHVRAAHTYTCKWVGCSHPSFASREGLVWHVESEHLLVCPCRGCDESGFEDPRVLRNHIAVGHPEVAKDGIKQWQLSTQVTAQSTEAVQPPAQSTKPAQKPADTTTTVLGKRKTLADDQERQAITAAKRKFQEQLRSAISKRARRASSQPSTSQSSIEDRSSPRGKFTCRACSDRRSFAKFEALTRHYRVVHPEYSMPQASRPRGAVVTSPSSFFPTPVSVTSTPTYFPISPGTVRTPTSSGGTTWATPLSPLQESLSRSAAINDKPVPFPLIFEHAILPFLVAFLPRWIGPRHVVSVTRGRTPQARRICITTPEPISRARKILIAKHLHDLLSLPESQHHRSSISFLFPVGTVDRTYGTSCWARGISRENMDDVCVPRNPFYFSSPCMGDSIGISATEDFEESTATLGPCLSVDGGNYWLANFHPFVDAYQSADPIVVEHPSAQDRAICVSESHDAVASKSTFQIGNVQVTSGLTLKTTRISHDPYWEDYGMDPPLIVTDWALIDARSSHANILRRFPIDYPHRTAPEPESLVRETSAIVPGAPVVSSGRTSGYGTGQICEIPAYVSGAENGVQKATREWFIEESYASDDEEEWIRGGIGVHGDSGAAVVDAETGCLVGQLWGRNKYWGPGPRHTFFTPIADIFDDIQEKCGQQTRPQLPQYRSEGDCYPVEPPCRTCYDTYRNLDSRRSSRLSLQSMVIATGEMGEQDGATSIEAASELATPRPLDRNPNAGLEEIGMTFGTVLWSAPTPSRASQGIASPGFNDMRSPYAQTLELDDLQERDHSTSDPLRKRASYNAFGLSPRASSQPSKRPRLVE